MNIGDRIGLWTITGLRAGDRIPARCECGLDALVLVWNLKSGTTKGCRACRARKPSVFLEPGQRFGRWTVLREGDRLMPNRRGQRLRQYLCRCDCGRERPIPIGNLLNGLSTQCQSCAATLCSGARTHGMSHSPEYRTWMAMIGRCTDVKDGGYPNYGGRGIVVCEEWLGRGGFDRFFAHIGPRPGPGYSIDRIDNDGNYEPGNVRWATAKEQARNKRDSHRIAIDGREHTLQEVGDMAGVSREAIRLRIKAGWSTDQLLLPRGEGPAAVRRGGRRKQHGLAFPLHAFWSHLESA